MTVQLPPWLQPEPPADAPSPFSSIAEPEGHELQFVTGTRAMGWLAHHLHNDAEETLWVDLDGARTVADAVLLTGYAMGISSPGRSSAVASALAKLPIKHLVWDGRNVSADVIHAAHSMLTALTRGLRCWASSDRDLNFGACVSTESEASEPPEDLPVELDILAWLPRSRRLRIPLPPELQRPDAAPGRLRMDVMSHLQQNPRRSIGSIADQIIHHHEHLFALATGATLDDVSPEDLFGLRLISEYASDENVACVASACASLLRIRFGQPTDALERLDQGLRRTTFADPAHRALLVWTEARIHLNMGEISEAASRFVDATNLAHAARDLGLLATMNRRWADTLSSRGEHERAADHYRSARALYRQRANTDGMCAALRGSADQAVATGELLSAEALYDQAEMHTTTEVEQANRLLGWAGLAIAQGTWERARRLLDRASRTAYDDALIQANCVRRKADISLRTGDPITALSQAEQAQFYFAKSGHTAASARCLRLCGDAEAMQGAYQQAMTYYRSALHDHIRCGDKGGLERTSQHITGLLRSMGDEESAGSFEHIAHEFRGDAF